MKPVRLVIEGINSFTERQELDFEAVGRNNLFCICGKTGAGKTTIFDSIMFALYGSGNRGTLADMVNLSLMKARVEFEFTAGGEEYRVERTLKCRIEKSDDDKKKSIENQPTDGAKRTATSDCMLYKNGEPFAKGGEANDVLSAVIGLDKDEFKNVYLLEQGEYADFLKKTPAKQTEAVGKIFSLMRYGDVHKKAGDKLKEQNAVVESLDKRIADVGEDSPNRLREITKEHSSLRAKNAALEKSIAAAKAELDGLNETRDKYLSYLEKANAVKRTAIALDEANGALDEAKAALENFGEEEERDAADKAKLEQLRARQNELIELNAWDKDHAATVKDIEVKRNACKLKEKEYSDCAVRVDEAKARVTRAHAEFDGKIGEFIARAASIENRSEALEAIVAELTSPSRKLGSVSEGIRKLDGELNTYKSNVERKGEAQKRRDGEAAKIDQCVKRIEAYGAETSELEKLKADAEKDVENAARALTAAQTGSHAAAVRAELCDGDVCPVCGGVYRDGSHVENDTDVEKRKAELEKAKKRAEEITEKISAVRRTSDLAKSDLERASDAVRQAEEQIAELDGRMQRARVTEAHAELISILDVARVLGDGFGEATAEKNKVEPELARLKAELDGAKSSVSETEAKAEQLRSRLGDMLGNTERELSGVKKSITDAESVIAARNDRRNELKGKCDAAKANVDLLTRQLAEARRDCPVDMPSFDEQDYADKKQRFDALTKEYNERDKEIAVAEAQMRSLGENCEKLKGLQAERATVHKKCDCYKTIVDLTKGKAMLNYVVAEYISDFTATASDILAELSGGKYTLAYDTDNGFMVKDYLSGGGTRKASTLSGGEMFLASLSVAIAIAREQSKGNNAFFFLDEGFGTLDDELIDTVFGALDILSKDCLVGVISHASALIERMPVCVEVGEATDTRGSTISY